VELRPDPLDSAPLSDPLVIEPFVGWRVWDVGVHQDEFVLESLFYTDRWMPGETMIASCHYGCSFSPAPAGETHGKSSRTYATLSPLPCGIYAAKSLDLAASYLPPALRKIYGVQLTRTRCVIGKVALWGVVIEHEKGYRAQYAKPLSLHVPVSFGFPVASDHTDAELVARRLAHAYEIPVKMFRRVGDLEDA